MGQVFHNRAPKLGCRFATRVGGMVRPYSRQRHVQIYQAFAYLVVFVHFKLILAYGTIDTLVNYNKFRMFGIEISRFYQKVSVFCLFLTFFLHKICMKTNVCR